MYAVVNPARRAMERAFAGRVPGVELHFENDWSEMLCRRLQTGGLDLTFTMVGAPDSGLEKLMIDETAAPLVMRADDELARLDTVGLSDLCGSRILVYPRDLSPWVYERLAVPLGQAGADVVELREPTLPAAMAQVQHGDGVFLAVPWEVHLVHEDVMEGLTLRPTQGGPGLRYALWIARRDSDPSPLSQTFWNVAQEVAAARATVTRD
jgi:DNA-binding transcriptional LysR family regulator